MEINDKYRWGSTQYCGHIPYGILIIACLSIIVFTDDNADLKINAKKSCVIQYDELIKTIRAHRAFFHAQQDPRYGFCPAKREYHWRRAKKEHIQKIQKKKHSNAEKINANVCPRYSGELIQKTG